ncbi:16S rRNA (cytosine(1402)-N(4))-methyltransferase RsmH [uncultured Campylobacter sp.]|uniref:16S rRNA (cytosine(1402)-N(4))-methyltransferase RsmH n=1 Tax=uncultured Campylobacter sp. TaxID=218934 RepID=UPI002635587C|nr:16S rRNA (cytosine(1402)-N(4))-methyltransferase RsmH [uncultured Campylobacter sp.]
MCKHIPVLLDEFLKYLPTKKDGIALDCTLGFAGHSEALLNTAPNLKLIACDKDEDALEFSKTKLKKFGDRVKIIKSDFKDIFSKLSTDEIKNLRFILADIGVSSYQLDEDERGFSTNSNFLDMRMDKSMNFNAKKLVNSYSKEDLQRIFMDFAELKDAKNIAEKIYSYRLKKQIESAKELRQIIGKEKLKGRSISKATLVFQAIRIEVNSELKALETLLKNLEQNALKDCIVAIISFHSLEDGLVKKFFKQWSKSCVCGEMAYKCTCGNNNSKGEILSKKPIQATLDEIKANSRSSCAKMRLFYFR